MTEGMIFLKKAVAFFLSFIFILLMPADLAHGAFTTHSKETSTESIDEPDSGESDFGTSGSGMPQVSAEAAMVMDAKTGQVLYEKNGYQAMYPASITKIMTTLLALEQGTLPATITMSETAVWGIDRNSSHIALDVDEKITLEQALYAVMIASANEAAWAVAEYISGTLSDFSTLMNTRAEELGCVNTHFVNANGLHDDDHYTCAYDMALITKEALTHREFRTITSTFHYIIPPTNMNEEQRDLWQKNHMINPDSQYYYKYCEGGKTGFTDEAGGTLVTWAMKDDVELICVLMNARPTSDNFTDSVALYDYFFDNYSYQTPLDDYVFSAEQLTSAENFLNNYYGGKNVGTMVLSVDNPGELFLPNPDDALTVTIQFSEERLSEHIIGTLLYGNEAETYIELPISYSGYINSPDDKSVEETIASGVIKDTTKKKIPSPIILFLILLFLGSGIFLYLRIRYIQKQRQLYRRRRNSARQNNKPF